MDPHSLPLLYEGRKFSLRASKELKKEAIIHPGAVVILPIVNAEEIILIRNERFVVQETLWELPAGTIENGETPLQTAEREIIEEIGYSANSIEYLLEFYASPGFCNEKLFVYLASNLTYVGQKLEENENIQVEQMPLKKALEMIHSGSIQDAKTISTLLYYQQFIV